MNAIKFTLMAVLFSFSSLVFADDAEDLKALVDEVVDSYKVDNLGKEFLAAMGNIQDLVYKINRKAFGPASKTLDSVASKLNDAAGNLVKFSKLIKENTMFRVEADELEKMTEALPALQTKLKEFFIVTMRQKIKTQLKRLVEKFEDLRVAITTGKEAKKL